jgi:hypothetical protein
MAAAALAIAALAAAPAMARETRSGQSLPSQAQGQVHADTRGSDTRRGSDDVLAAAATPAYCSGNKNGIGNGASLEHGQGKALTCAKSPG